MENNIKGRQGKLHVVVVTVHQPPPQNCYLLLKLELGGVRYYPVTDIDTMYSTVMFSETSLIRTGNVSHDFHFQISREHVKECLMFDKERVALDVADYVSYHHGVKLFIGLAEIVD